MVIYRSSWMRDNSLCFNCFSDSHWSNKRRSKPSCTHCLRKHHSILHINGRSNMVKADESATNTALCAAHLLPFTSTTSLVMLGKALVRVRDHSGTCQTMRALVDCGTQINGITASCTDRFCLRRTHWTAPVTGLSGLHVTDVLIRVNCTIQPRFGSEPSLFVQA